MLLCSFLFTRQYVEAYWLIRFYLEKYVVVNQPDCRNCAFRVPVDASNYCWQHQHMPLSCNKYFKDPSTVSVNGRVWVASEQGIEGVKDVNPVKQR